MEVQQGPRLQHVHRRTTRAAGRRCTASSVPGPSKDLPPDAPPTLVFDMFPAVYDIPFHYANPVTGPHGVPPIKENTRLQVRMAAAAAAPAGCRRRSPRRCARSARRSKAGDDGSCMRRCSRKSLTPNVTLTRDVSYGPHERHVLDVFVSPETRRRAQARRRLHPRRRLRARLEAHARLAVLRQHRAVGGSAWARRRHDQLPPGAAVPVSRRRRRSDAPVAWLQRAHQRSTVAIRTRFSCGATRPAPRTRRITSRASTNAGKKPGIAGAILTSGFYRARRHRVSMWKAYYGEDVSKYTERSSLDWAREEHGAAAGDRCRAGPADTFKPRVRQRVADARAKAGRPVTRVKLDGSLAHLRDCMR